MPNLNNLVDSIMAQHANVDGSLTTEEASTVGDVEQIPEQKAIDLYKKEEHDQCFDYNKALISLKSLTSYWGGEEQRTESNRKTRDIDINVDALRDSGDIEPDETFIPVRVIDGNIIRETPPYINFLKNSNRIAIFKDALDPTFNTGLLEEAFTQGMTYKGWIKPFFKVVDGAATHGWASVEIVFDDSKPLKAGIEYVAHEDLIFYQDAKDINALSCILRRYRLTIQQLKGWVDKFGFDFKQVQQVCQQVNESQDKDRTLTIYKRFKMFEGIVYTSWFSIDGNTTDWLKAPVQHYIGIDERYEDVETQMIPTPTQVPQTDMMGNVIGSITTIVPTPTQVPVTKWRAKPLTFYPCFILPYRETEKPMLFDHVGRVFLDRNKQEAQTAVTTGFVNGLSRAMKIYGSPETDNVQDGRPAKQLPVALAQGTIMDKPFKFWAMPPPDPLTLKAIEYMDTANAAEIGQTAFAVTNRPDSRKTATEIKSAEKDSDLLNSVDLTLFSEFIRDVYSLVWLIVQSQALQNRIKFLLINQQVPVEGTLNVLGTQQMETRAVNDVDTVSRNYDVRAAGDVDVIQKDATLQMMQSDWPIVQNTPVASLFLSDYLKLKYPQNGGAYATALQQGDPKVALIKALGVVVDAMAKMPEVAQHLGPAEVAQLKQLEAQVVAIVNPQGARPTVGNAASNSPNPEPRQKQLPPAPQQ